MANLGNMVDGMARRTLLQQQLEKSKRLLSERKSELTSSETESPQASLGKYIRRGELPPVENPFDGPFLHSTSTAVKKRAGDFGTIASQRLQRMRQGVEADAPMIDTDQAPSATKPNFPAWVNSDVEDMETRNVSTPLWRDVLSKQRGHVRPTESARQHHSELIGAVPPPVESPLKMVAEELAIGRPGWPPIFTPNQNFTWSNWQVGPNNRLASTAGNEVITHPSERANPLIIFGGEGVGKSHLLRAIGSSMHTRSPEDEVRIIVGSSFPSQLSDDWVDAVQGCSTLLIDDIQSVGEDSEENLGIIIDSCLNFGVQVVITSSENCNYSGILGGALRSSVEVNLDNPDVMTLVLFMRNRALVRGLPLSDEQLRAIAVAADRDWSVAESGFEAVALAIEAGAEPFGVGDIETILSGEELVMRGDDGLIAWDTERTGQRIVREVLDHVLPKERQPNVDIISELESIVDDYQPPDLMPDTSRDAVDSLIERHLGREKGALEDARDRIELSGLPTTLEEPRGEVPNIELTSEGFLDRLESRLRRHQDELFSLHGQMEDISSKIENAEPKELVEMADKMLEIERKLSRISKLGAGESLKTRTKPERPYEAVGIEEYIPETDWDIDEESVSADDLLVPVTQLHPVVILRTADPSEMSQSFNLGDI
ncbi:MAG TPA: hypothetical protein EYN58_03455 [Candidatus Poseidoniales archaeon]|nr:MAG: hypothetical protein CXX81_15965 [Euryarchaeota archaeon]HHZ74232.1 hypothetical protein [Candidatus Poseidoniales archaeon]PXY78213.1 MAG: hypothetical protein CXX81_08835 [Euryarchaeota archaeon]PXY79782.1 MAG: hypothetical protein CXX81_01360 [Euryarchaeota archaeon]HIA25672.1 hypothetical protein [Candidatus Poseidoniales archaeon]